MLKKRSRGAPVVFQRKRIRAVTVAKSEIRDPFYPTA